MAKPLRESHNCPIRPSLSGTTLFPTFPILESDPHFRSFKAMTTYTSAVAIFAASRLSTPLRTLLPQLTKRAITGVFWAANLQVALGITTLLYLVPVPLAAAHQAGSVVLLSAVVAVLASLRRPSSLANAWRVARSKQVPQS